LKQESILDIIGLNKATFKEHTMINSKELLSYTKNLSILFAEDDDEFRTATSDILKNFFLDVKSVKNGLEALEAYTKHYKQSNQYYDLVLSDIRMPKINGIELTSELYAINPDQAVIILSAHEETHHLLPLINLGVKQYIKKPIDYQEFLKALLHVSKNLKKGDKADRVSQINMQDSFVFDKHTEALTHNASSIYLTKYEIIFMQLLTTNIGKIYTNEEISSHFSDKQETLNAANIRKLVSKLRKKLPENTIESVYGIGYKFLN
jgi:DNA-binding response OmpR family regulator